MVSRCLHALVRRIGHLILNRQTRTGLATPSHLSSACTGLSVHHVFQRRSHLRTSVLPSTLVTERLVVQIDGTPGSPACGIAGLGIVVRSEHGDVIRMYCGRAPAHTSNEAEYQALIAALQFIQRDFPGRRIRCLTDSRLVVDQLSGIAAVRDETLRVLHQSARVLIDQCSSASFELIAIPRDLNRLADALAWEALKGRRDLLNRLRTITPEW